MSLAFRIAAPLLLVGSLLGGVLILDAWQSERDRRLAADGAALSLHTAALMQAEAAFAAERGATNGLLANPAGATPEGWAQARARGAEGEARLAGARAAVEALGAT
ncbi:hypothetical protein E2C05_31775, partial [Paracraurococcus ruber]|uniref:hypothetical protein n=1 Tax=Paracraurococcus ruber TaxID=77675 RepID=UPI0010575FC4